MTALIYGSVAFTGIIAGAFIVVPAMTIVCFALPFTHDLKKKQILTSNAPAVRYALHLVLLVGLFGLVSWAVCHHLSGHLWTYVAGVILAAAPNIAVARRTEDKLPDFFRLNAEYVDNEAWRQHVTYGPTILGWEAFDDTAAEAAGKAEGEAEPTQSSSP